MMEEEDEAVVIANVSSVIESFHQTIYAPYTDQALIWVSRSEARNCLGKLGTRLIADYPKLDKVSYCLTLHVSTLLGKTARDL